MALANLQHYDVKDVQNLCRCSHLRAPSAVKKVFRIRYILPLENSSDFGLVPLILSDSKADDMKRMSRKTIKPYRNTKFVSAATKITDYK